MITCFTEKLKGNVFFGVQCVIIHENVNIIEMLFGILCVFFDVVTLPHEKSVSFYITAVEIKKKIVQW